MMIAAVLQRATLSLADACESPRLDAEVLLGRVTGLSRAGLVARGGEPLDPAQQTVYEALLARRRAGEPVAYLTGRREFWSLDLKVTADVLVPRSDTEVLVEQALALLPEGPCRVLDLGTGSGAIALALAAERPRAHIIAVDVSAPALAVARANGAALGLCGIDWRLGSWFDALQGERFDLIAANPPYVAAGDPALSRLRAEPALALVGGPTGLEALEHIVRHAPAHLEPGGWLVLEHGSTQAADVAGLLGRHGFHLVRSQADLAGHARVTLGAAAGSPHRSTSISHEDTP